MVPGSAHSSVESGRRLANSGAGGAQGTGRRVAEALSRLQFESSARDGIRFRAGRPVDASGAGLVVIAASTDSMVRREGFEPPTLRFEA